MFHVPQVTPTLWPYGKVNVRKPSQVQTLITTNKDDVEDNGLTMLVSKDECSEKDIYGHVSISNIQQTKVKV